MDAILAIVSPHGDDATTNVASLAFERLWPSMEPQVAVWSDRDVLLARAQLPGAGQGAGTGGPGIRLAGDVVLSRRWDWPALAEADGATEQWCELLAPSAGLAAPTADVPACIAWLPAQRSLVVLRDALGEGSVWYAAEGERLAVASHPLMLLSLPWIPTEPDPVGLELAGFGGAPGHLTPWRGIRRLPAGHRLIWRDGLPRIDRWWVPAAAAPAGKVGDEAWFDRARQALTLAVARRIPQIGTVGAHLSGGLDSTAVSLVAAPLLSESGRALHTFSHLPAVRWTPPRPGDETPYVEAALARMPNAVPHCCTDQAGEGLRFGDRPLLGHDRAVRDAARGAGVGVLLSGWGGDEGVSFNGDGYLAGQLRRFQLADALGWCWQFSGRSLRRLPGVVLYKLVFQQLGFLRPTAVHPDPARASRRAVLRHLSRASRDAAERSYPASRRLRSAASPHENQRRLLTSPHLANRIDSDAEWSIPAGFCFRYPLLDPEVLAVALAVPERLLVLNGRTRTLIREAMRGLYPPLIRERQGKFVSHPGRPTFRPAE